ncbi:2-succinyl-5-enolpyruvyl-6-hydroxy-3-cyclohexene-1-carboxylate synthase [Raineyella antarctica]|uniref:2-succinyl-5-enolpyruvyl-6-hydroxy-3-cyclohexene-1-carboxylate synthase n=1 Tax=Raineyella antarctica TaxID=1577474 RepID=A0A1G6GFH8_9ACTN|nr:2-succinyl-5-enolpyruvyl-6-hydroxy-3-cyclohexene-1-carboxylic-acid synthase [Raineyella antarctica]SDB80724.1 2-succinyl-5-enolpyruvyl-6-hydroxy-3-cyclohexene-1-carboxylate synthase [Raineyella antarctica]
MNPSTALARAVIAQLVANGVEHLVVCPGSRNAPLLLAAHLAAAAGRLRLHVRHDERVAGFTAHGIARVTGLPVPVVVTSGTAVGNLLPAVMEASHTGVPLVVVSADRPTGMLDTGANQTTNQVGIFGTFVRAEANLEADAGPLAVRHQVARVLASADGMRTRAPGPGHLNVRLAAPLVPDPGDRGLDWLDVDAPSIAPLGAGMLTELEPGPRTVVLVGSGQPSTGARARRNAEEAGVPLLAGPISNAREGAALATYRLLLDTSLADRIERVVVYGRPTLSRPVTRLLSRRDVEVVVVADSSEWSDVGLHASAVADEVLLPAGDPDWLAEWQRADAQACEALAGMLRDQPGLTGPEVAAAVVASVGPQDVLLLGNSQSLRDADLAPVSPAPAHVIGNRGLSGIDGLVSTASGAAIGLGRPVTALVGDVSLAHDGGGLLIGPGEETPDLRVVVVNDDGGAIFHTLEQGDPTYDSGPYAGAFDRLFGTPHGVDFSALARAYGWRHRRITGRDELAAALAAPVTGREVLEVPLDRADRRAFEERIRRLV